MLEHEDSIGPHGIPWEDALDPESDGWFEVQEHTDYAQAALDRWHEDHKEAREPGVRLVVVSARAGGNGAQGGDEPPHGAADDADEGA